MYMYIYIYRIPCSYPRFVANVPFLTAIERLGVFLQRLAAATAALLRTAMLQRGKSIALPLPRLILYMKMKRWSTSLSKFELE